GAGPVLPGVPATAPAGTAHQHRPRNAPHDERVVSTHPHPVGDPGLEETLGGGSASSPCDARSALRIGGRPDAGGTVNGRDAPGELGHASILPHGRVLSWV